MNGITFAETAEPKKLEPQAFDAEFVGLPSTWPKLRDWGELPVIAGLRHS